MPTRPFLTAEWRDLAMLNYEIDPDVLRARVPQGAELDAWESRTFVSVVGFRFLDTRVCGFAIPGHRNFEEVNLRFYVRRKVDGAWRRGVVFIKEIVPRHAIAWVARAIYNENYHTLATRHDVTVSSSTRRVAYRWRHAKRWQGLAVECAGRPSLPPEASEEAFITEHYWGYARQRAGGTVEYRVEHPRWRVLRATRASFDCDVSDLYGPEFASVLQGEPSSAFLADGSEVVVHRGVRL